MIRKKLNEFLENNTYQTLTEKTGVNSAIVNSIINGNPKKIRYRKSTLDALYDFFNLKIDNFYNDNMKKRYPATDSMLGTYLRNKRIELGLSQDEVAQHLKSTKLTIARIELGESLPLFGSYTMQNLMYLYKLTPVERQLIKNFIRAVKDIEKLIKKA